MKARSLLLVICLSSTLYANMVWPALYLEAKIFTWWTVVFGLLIEYVVLRVALKLPIKKLFIATITANLISTILGFVLIPLSGLALEIVASVSYNNIFDYGTFNPITWTLTFILACFLNTVIESFAYRKIFKIQKTFKVVFIANFLSIGIAFASIFIFPIRM